MLGFASENTSEIKNLDDQELNFKIKDLAAQERKLNAVVLLHIAEVDRRKLYLRMAYPSLFEYLTQEVGYSAGSAQRRIDSARLLNVVPEIPAKIEQGTLSMLQISKAQKIFRLVRKQSGQKVHMAIQRQVIHEIENKTAEQTEHILAKRFNVSPRTDIRKFVQKDESVRIEMTFTKAEMETIKNAQAILSNIASSAGAVDLKQVIVLMASKVVKENSLKLMKALVNPNVNTTATTATVAVKNSKQVNPKLKFQIIARDKCCQFINKSTGKVCGSQAFLNIDHIIPRFAGGDNQPANLRVLCKSHNVFRYREGL